jgi:poly-gamma-glutamate capsule biosynthesis protein CapA/YwtB (metallophosphatase superfamily)
VLLDRAVGDAIARHGDAFPFAKVRPVFAGADIAFVNLECPITAHAVEVKKQVVFRARPATAACLSNGGIDIVSLANNHALDCGPDGLTDTMAHLKASGIRWCGVAPPPSEAASPTITTVHGIRIAFLGFCQFPPDVESGPSQPAMSVATEDTVRRSVASARREADVVVVSFHWGVEYDGATTGWQVHMAHIAARAGADVVIGHHPHVLQGVEVVTSPIATNYSPAKLGGTGVPPIESVTPVSPPIGYGSIGVPPVDEVAQASPPIGQGRTGVPLAEEVEQASLPVIRAMRRRCYIFYSLGNCVFDPLPGYPTDAALVRCQFTRNGVTSAEVIPIILDHCRPRHASATDARRILRKISTLSRPWRTHLRDARVMAR